MRFFGEQGAWYTVGWKMAVTIERQRGREHLVRCMRDPRHLVTTWNAIAATDTGLPQWSEELVDALSPPEATE